MPRHSAGILLCRRRPGSDLEVLLVHPGGPWWSRKDRGAWSIPKGEAGEGEPLDQVAEREFTEELGQPCPPGPRMDLGQVRQAGGKVVQAWAVVGDVEAATVQSNTFEMEWPPHSGRTARFPEVDRAEWFPLATAHEKVVGGQRPLLDRLADRLEEGDDL